jgi:hypothetical protein
MPENVYRALRKTLVKRRGRYPGKEILIWPCRSNLIDL